MIDVNELLEEEIRETENLNEGEVFLVKAIEKTSSNRQRYKKIKN